MTTATFKSSGAKEPIVKISDLSLIYNPGKTTEFQALKNISLEIYPEEFVIFFGPSGSGKSTLLYIIAGLEIPTQGIVSVAGNKNISQLSEKELIQYHRSSVGMIFQAFYLLPSLTAKDNVVLPMVFSGTSIEERNKAADVLMDRFGITPFKDRTPARLSGGQQQRVAIARSLVNDPEIVLADEPVGNLDSKNSAIVLELIKDLHTRDKKTVILVTHDASHLPHANRVFYIKDGEIVRVVEQTPKVIPKTEDAVVVPTSHETLLSRLAQRYPHLDETQLKSKLLVNFVLEPYDLDMLDHIENLVSGFLSKKLSEKELLKQLDAASEKGGSGLYKQTATKLVEQIKKLIKEIEMIGKEPHQEKADPWLDEASQVVRFILDEYEGSLTAAQVTRFKAIISTRLQGKTSKENLFSQLDKSFKKGGVGLNKQTAKRFAQEIEVILMQKSS